MVFSEAAAAVGGAAGVSQLWHYNRSNFFYDRKMRQEQEFQLLDYRTAQAELWREDIRDIIGLTEKKMDSYLIISVLQVEMCVGFFTEGRLEPGTPPWLLHFYMLTLGAAFMYLLMATWLCMHASVVATCSSARLLTQFVRLPIPTWEQIQEMRTFGSAYESVGLRDALRIPFTGDEVPEFSAPQQTINKTVSVEKVPPPPTNKHVAASASSASSGKEQPKWADPWRTEATGEDRSIYELTPMRADMRRHVQLAKQASAQYQCYDAFARVSMTFGTNQLLHAVAYYALGYGCVQDDAGWAASSVVVICCGIAMALVHLDFSLTRAEVLIAHVLLAIAYASSASATLAWQQYGLRARPFLIVLLPVAYASHMLWLLWGLRACGLTRQPDGVVLPVRFKAVLYLDVFGWLRHGTKSSRDKDYKARPSGDAPLPDRSRKLGSEDASAQKRAELEQALQADISLWQSEGVVRAMDQHDRARVQELAERVRRTPFVPSNVKPKPANAQWVQINGYSDIGTEEFPYLLDPESGETQLLMTESQASGNKYGGDKRVRTIASFHERVDNYCLEAENAMSTSVDVGEGFVTRNDSKLKLVSKSSGIVDDAAEVARQVSTPLLSVLGLGNDEFDGYEGAVTQPTFVGPAGEVHMPPDQVFHPRSYGYPGVDEENPSRQCSEEIVTGHDQTHPGRLPAKVFRAATLMVALLWGVGLSVPFGIVRDFLVEPMHVDIFMGGEGTTEGVKANLLTGPDGLPELVPAATDGQPREIPRLGDGQEGKEVIVGWPSHASFVPRAFNTDATGTRFVVGDDFAIYSSLLSQELRGKDQTPSFRLNFQRIPLCTSLEGQAMDDIDVVCMQGEQCQVAVVYDRGTKFTVCPLVTDAMPSPAQQHSLLDPERPWSIKTDWLRADDNPPEKLRSIAVNNDCFKSSMDGAPTLSMNTHCLVVGTSSGRILELGISRGDPRLLVPHRTIHKKHSSASPRGALTFLANGILVALWHKTQMLEAFDSTLGVSIGEWSLPSDVVWLMLCGGGDGIFMLGVAKGVVVVQRFDVPEELNAASVQSASHSEM